MEKKLIKLNFKNELSSKSIRVLSYEIMIDRIRILKSLTCTTSVLEKKKGILFLFNFQRFFLLLTYPSHILYTDLLCPEDVSLNQG